MIESEHAESIAEARAAAGALFFDETGHVLLVRPSYKPGWEIPGGYLRPGETQTEAAAREVEEELGIKPPIGRLLVADWAPHPVEGDKVLFVFDGGRLAPDYLGLIRTAPGEITDWAFHDPNVIHLLLIPRLARRISAALIARATDQTVYLEHGVLPPDPLGM
jgi:8-oxo-dGTP diphosphatase